MRSLNERQQLFVEHYVSAGLIDATAAAEAAGYSGASRNSLYVQAHRLTHDPKVGEAIKEVVGQRFNAALPVALQALLEIASDPSHKDRGNVAKFLAELAGFSPVKQIEVKSDIRVSFPELLARYKAAVAEIGPSPPLIDVTPTVEIEDEEG